MYTLKHVSVFNRMHRFITLLLIGLLIPTSSALAKTPAVAPGSFGKYLPADGAENQPVSLLLKWDSSDTATSYEYCIDTLDNNACDTGWVDTGTANFAIVNLTGNTVYYWNVRASDGAGIAYANSNTWWSLTSAPESLIERKKSASLSTPTADDKQPLGNASLIPMTVTNMLQDPSFEASYGSSFYWSQYSTNFGTPLCIIADCNNGGGTAGPRTGSVWGWFGGVPADEIAAVWQAVNFPACNDARFSSISGLVLPRKAAIRLIYLVSTLMTH